MTPCTTCSAAGGCALDDLVRKPKVLQGLRCRVTQEVVVETVKIVDVVARRGDQQSSKQLLERVSAAIEIPY